MKEVIDKNDLTRRIIRYWAQAIGDMNELGVLLFIADRTSQWGKDRERVTWTQITEGVYGKTDSGDRVCYSAGLPISRRTTARALASLTDKGLIFKHDGDTGEAASYSINEKWEPLPHMLRPTKKQKQWIEGGAISRDPGFNGDHETPHDGGRGGLRAPKQGGTSATLARGGCQVGTGVVPTGHGGSVRLAPQKRMIEEKGYNPLNETIAVPAISSIQGAVAEASRKNAEALDRRRARPGFGSSSLELCEKVWLPAMKRHWPKATSLLWTKVQRGKVKQLVTHWADTETTPVQFLEWVVEAWQRVNATKFVYVEEVAMPEFPDVDFLIRFKRAFLESWSRRNELEADLTANSEDKIRRRFRKQGFTHEEAEKRAGEEIEKGKTMDHVHRRMLELGRAERALEHKQAAARLQDGKGARERWLAKRAAKKKITIKDW